jgi:hypothetical protein
VTKHIAAPSHEPRWNAWTYPQAVQFDYEKAASVRPVLLSSPTAPVGDHVRIGLPGVPKWRHASRPSWVRCCTSA